MSKARHNSLITGGPVVVRRKVLQGVALVGAATIGAVLPLSRAAAELWEEGDLQCRPIIAEVEPDYVNDEMFAGFMRVSQALTGIEGLDPSIGSQYFERYARHPDLTKLLPPLLKAYLDIEKAPHSPDERKAAIRRSIIEDKGGVGQAAEQLIYLWYVSAFYLPADHAAASRNWIYGSVEQYQKSLLWTVVDAHPPMTSGGLPGHWALPPRS
jgi:hypothetical protein